MELRDYVRVVRRRWRVITACFLVVVAVAAGVTYRMTPQYQSKARLFVSSTDRSSSDAYQNALFSTQRVSSYADLASGRELASRVVKDLHLRMDPAQLVDKINATVVPNTVILEVSATDQNPRTAQAIAQSTARQLSGLVSELETPPGKAHAPIKATIIDSASLPTSPVSPKPLRNLGLAAVLGVLLGLGLAVLRELLDTTVKTPEDLAEVTDSPMLGGIMFDPAAQKQPLLSDLSPHAPRAEAFRILRTNLQFVDVDRDKKVFVVTSSVPGEGKTSTASNVALSLQEAGERVLLIDADLRRPQLARLFGLEPSVGLTSVLLGRIELQEAIQSHRPSGMDVLTSGNLPPNPAELLQSQSMHQLLGKARTEYDVIVIDTSPLLPVTDAALIAAQVDGALVVVRQGKTTRDQLTHSLERLEAVGARALGLALNMVPSRARGGYGYGYGYAPVEGRRAKNPSQGVAGA